MASTKELEARVEDLEKLVAKLAERSHLAAVAYLKATNRSTAGVSNEERDRKIVESMARRAEYRKQAEEHAKSS